MKKCIVCGKEYPATNERCPVCGYEMVDLYIGGYSTPENEAAEYRRGLTKNIRLYIQLFDKYIPDAKGEYLLPNGKVEKYLGTAEAAAANILWLDEPVCAVGDQVSRVDIPVLVKLNGSARTKNVTLPALPQHELLQLGIEVDCESFTGKLHMKNDSDEVVSPAFSLL